MRASASNSGFKFPERKTNTKYPEVSKQRVVSEDKQQIMGIEKPTPRQVLASNMTYSAQRHLKYNSINNLELTNRSPGTGGRALSSNTIEDIYSVPVNSNPSQNISTIEEKPSPLMPLNAHYNMSRTLKRGCRHLMKHVETDHMQRQAMPKYGTKRQPDAFSPKDLAVLSTKPLSQHPLTQAFLYKKQ